MALTDFTKATGTQQGRVRPLEFLPDREWSFVLGHERAGERAFFQVGDSVRSGQSGVFVPAVGPRINLIRFRGQIRAPLQLPPGADFRIAVLIDGIARASRLVGAGGGKRPLVDMAANVSDLGAGAHVVEFELKVVAV